MTDKIPTHDDKGYPLNNNVDFSTFYTTPEEFVQVPAIAYICSESIQIDI